MEKLNYNIDDIITRHLLGEASTEEQNLLLSWLKDDIQNQHYFFQMKEIWTASQIKNLKYTNTSWDNLKAMMEKNKNIELNSGKKKYYIKLFRYASFIAVLICIGLLAYHYSSNALNMKDETTYNEIVTSDGQKKEVELPDGTKVWINSGTKLKYASNFGKTDRELFLQGEAYFDVKRDTSKMFIVHAENITIKVLGTSFNVKCYPELKTIETTVISGTVSLESNEKTEGKDIVILNKKEKATFLKNQQKMYVTKNPNENPKSTVEPIELKKLSISDEETKYIASWKDQSLSFNNESFEEMAFKLQKWYNVKITIKDEKLKDYRYKGKFDNAKSIFEVLQVIKLTTPISYEYNEKVKEIIIKEAKD